MSELNKYSLGANIRSRLSATADFSKAITQCDQSDEHLKAKLTQAANDLWPAIKRVLTEGNLLESIFKYGSWNDKIVYEANEYGFGDLEDIQNQFKKLRSVWKQSISVRFSIETHRVSVTVSYVVW